MIGSPHTCPTSWARGCWTQCWHPQLGCGHGPGCSSGCRPPLPQPAQPGQDCPHFLHPGAGERVELPCKRVCGGHGARRSGREQQWHSWCWRIAEAFRLTDHNCTILPRPEHGRGLPDESGIRTALEFKALRLSHLYFLSSHSTRPLRVPGRQTRGYKNHHLSAGAVTVPLRPPPPRKLTAPRCHTS